MADRVSDDTIGAKLRRLRWDAGLTQAGLATTISLQQSQVSRIERGNTDLAYGQIVAWSVACGLSADLHFRRLDEPATPDGLPAVQRISADERAQIAADLRRALARLEMA